MDGAAPSVFRPHVYLSSGALYYELDVLTSCDGSPSCGDYPPIWFKGANWDVPGTFNGTTWDPTGRAGCLSMPQPGETIYVRVRPINGNPSCVPYTIVFRNG
jgi:hypothetical protein